MFALTVIYSVLFFYIRVQSTKFRNITSSNERTSSHQLQSWEANVDVGSENHPVSRQMISRTVTVVPEESPAPRRPGVPEEDIAHRRLNQAAFKLLAYPILYLWLTVPIGTVALASLAGHIWLKPVYIASCFYGSTGWANVILYTATRKGIISWDWIRKCTPKMSTVRSNRCADVSHHSTNVMPSTLSSKLSFSSAHPLVKSEQNSYTDSFSTMEPACNVPLDNTKNVGSLDREDGRTSG